MSVFRSWDFYYWACRSFGTAGECDDTKEVSNAAISGGGYREGMQSSLSCWLVVQGASGLQLKSAVEGRLTTAQQQILYTNRVLLLILAGRIQSAKDVTQRLSRRFALTESIFCLA